MDEKVSSFRRGDEANEQSEVLYMGWRRQMLTPSLVIGTLKGYDQLMNLVLDEVKEAMTGTLFET